MPQANDAVWVDVLPSMKKFGPALASGAEKDAATAGKAAGRKFGMAFKAGMLVLGAAAVAGSKALYGLGKTFDDLKVTIQQGTGASGKALDGLMDSAKNVGKKIPANFDDIGKALADLNTQTGASGKTLESLTSGVLEASRALGENGADNAALFGQTLNQANIPAKDGRKLLDKLYVASQKYGTSLGGMMKNLKKFGPQMQSAGLSMDQTIDLFGQFNKAGVSANRIVPSLNAAMVKWAKAGKDPAKMLQSLAKKVANAKTQQQAMQAVSQDMSGPGASAFVTAIRKSGVSLDGLGKSLKNSKGAVSQASKDTQAFSEKWKIFKNNVMVVLRPLATKLFDAIAKGMDWINKHGIPIIQSLAKWMDKNKTLMKVVLGVVGGLTAAFVVYSATMKVVRIGQALLNAVMSANPIGLVVLAIAGLVAAFVVAYKKSETFRKIVQAAWSGIKKAAKVVTDWFNNTAWPMMKKVFGWIGDKATWLWKIIIKPHFDLIWGIAKKVFGWIKNTGWPWIKKAFEGIGSVIKGTWNKVIKPTFNFIKTAVGKVKSAFSTAKTGIKKAFDAVGDVVKRIWRGLKTDFGYIKSGVGKVKDGFVKAKDGIVKAWDKVKEAARKPVAFVVNRVVRPFIGGINKVLDFVHLGHISKPAKMKTGGVLPGYTPGRDVHTFVSPTGGRLDLSGGEAVMRPEFTSAIGQSGVNILNRAAAHGGAGAVRRSLGGFKDGGVLPHRRMFLGGVWDKVKGAGSWLVDHTIGAAKAIWDFIRHPKQALKHLLPNVGNSWAGKIAASLPGKLASGLKSMVAKAFGFGGGDGGGPVDVKPVKGGGGMSWSGIEWYRPWLRGSLAHVLRNAQRQGWSILEFPPFGPVHPVHSTHSLHYLGQAADISTPGMRGGDAMARALAAAGFGVKWRVPGHYNHIHVDTSILDHMYGAWKHVPGYAGGGVAGRGLIKVGERGTELLQLGSTSRIYSNRESRGLMSGPVDLSDRTLSRLADAVASQVIEMDGHTVARIMSGYTGQDRASQRIANAGAVSA